MKKVFTLLMLALMSIGSAWAEEIVYALAIGETHKSGEVVTVKNGEVTVATITYGEEGGADFKAAKEHSAISYFSAFTEGNGENGNKAGGTFYTIKPIFDGTITIGVVINKDKTLVIEEDNVPMSGFEQMTEKYYGVQNFSVKAGSSYKVYVSGSKLGFYGFKFEYDPSAADEPSLKASSESITVGVTKSVDNPTAKFTITGKNLKDGDYYLTITDISGLSVSPISFTVSGGTTNQEFTVSYHSEENVRPQKAAITATANDKTVNIEVNYFASVNTWSLQPIREAISWDFSKISSNTESDLYNSDNKGILLTSETTPSNAEDFIYENYNGTDIAIASGFDGTSIAFSGQYPVRNNSYSQAGTIHLITEVPGNVTVKFSDTGSSPSSTATPRYLMINGLYTEYWTSRPTTGTVKSNDTKTSGAISVPAGDIKISGSQAHCYYIVTFTPSEAPTSISANITNAGYATFCSQYEVELSDNLSAYYVSSIDNNSAILKEVTDYIPANTPVILKGEAKNYDLKVTTTGAAIDGKNLLTGCIGDCTPNGDNYYTLAVEDSKPIFKKSSGGTLAAGKAFLYVTDSNSRIIYLSPDNETTGINEMKEDDAECPIMYNVSGVRVNKPMKGMYIQNGKKIVVK